MGRERNILTHISRKIHSIRVLLKNQDQYLKNYVMTLAYLLPNKTPWIKCLMTMNKLFPIDWIPKFLRIPVAIFCIIIALFQSFNFFTTINEIGIGRALFLLIIIFIHFQFSIVLLKSFFNKSAYE